MARGREIGAGHLGNHVAYPVQSYLGAVLLQMGLQLIGHLAFVSAGRGGKHKLFQNFLAGHINRSFSLRNELKQRLLQFSVCINIVIRADGVPGSKVVLQGHRNATVGLARGDILRPIAHHDSPLHTQQLF